MFIRSLFGNQIQGLPFGAYPPAGAGVLTAYPIQIGPAQIGPAQIGPAQIGPAQIGGYNPLLPIQAPPLNAIGVFNPVLPPIGSYGINPYQAVQFPGVHLMTGLNPAFYPAVNPTIAPMAVSPSIMPVAVSPAFNSPIATQLGVANPVYLPNLAPQIVGSAFQPSPTGVVNPFLQPIGAESGYLGQPPLPLQSNLQFLSPITQDPISASWPVQPLNPMVQHRLPIRPLVTQQFDPFQAGLSGILNPSVGQMIDPYTGLAVPLTTSFVANPIQQMTRAYPPTNWGSPHSMGQPLTFGQGGVPFHLY